MHFETLGHIDELNSVLGFARHHCVAEHNGLAPAVEEVQACLIQLMSHVATPKFLDEEEVRRLPLPSSAPSRPAAPEPHARRSPR